MEPVRPIALFFAAASLAGAAPNISEAPGSPSAPKTRTAYAAAIALADAGDASGAIDRLSIVIAMEPDFAQARFDRARLRAESGDLNGAIVDFANAAKRAPRGSGLAAEARYERARCLFAQMDYSRAAADAGGALDTRPDFAEALALRAACRNALDQPHLALEDARQAAALDPALGPAWLEGGLSHIALRQPDEAIASLTRAIELFRQAGASEAAPLTPDGPAPLVVALTARGEAHDSVGRIREAIADFTAAIALDPGAYDALVGRVLSLSRVGRRDEAMADCERAIAAAPARIRADHPASLLLASLRAHANPAPASASAADR